MTTQPITSLTVPRQHDPRDPKSAPPVDFETLRFRVQTLNGLLQHYAHLAEEAALIGDPHGRDVNAGKHAAYQHAAHEVAALLWPTDGVS